MPRLVPGLVVLLLLFALVAAVGWACAGNGETAVEPTGEGEEAAYDPPASASDESGGGSDRTSAGSSTRVADDASAEDGAETAQSAAGVSDPGDLGVGSLEYGMDRKVVTESTMGIEVESGTFDTAFDQALLLADGYGGYVVSSRSDASADEHGPRSGTVTLRIPELSFSKALEDAAGLGTVRSREISSRDVTEEYVDLEARLENARAQESALRKLLGETGEVDEILKVRNVLSGVQEQIEQIKGRLRYLEEHTSLTTLSLTLYEEGVQVALTGGWGFTGALEDAARAFVATVNGMIVGLGSLLPVLLVLGLVAAAAYRMIRPIITGDRRTAGSPAEASTLEAKEPPSS